MGTQLEQQRPNSPPPDDRKKEQLNAIIARGPDGTVYEIPIADAKKFKISAAREKELQCAAVKTEEDEVGGRHMVPLQGGGIGGHSDWLYGPYIWWRDLGAYRGWHWHPNRHSVAAYDEDDY